MKKRRWMLGSAIMLVVLLVAGGTLAWFTATTPAVKNEFKAGTVKIELIDKFKGAPNVNPGDCYNKEIYVKNTGTKKAYIRIKADAVFDGGQSTDVLRYGFNKESIGWFNYLPGWKQVGDYIYYSKIVAPGSYTRPLLKCNRICFDGPSMDNTYQGAKLDITINADAIQATHGAAQAEWGVGSPTIRPFSSDGEAVDVILSDEVEELTLADVEAIIAQEEAAFEALE